MVSLMGSKFGKVVNEAELTEPHPPSTPERDTTTPKRRFSPPPTGASVSATVNFQTYRHLSAAAAAPRGRPAATLPPPPVSSNPSLRLEPARTWRNQDPTQLLLSQPPSWSGLPSDDVTRTETVSSNLPKAGKQLNWHKK